MSSIEKKMKKKEHEEVVGDVLPTSTIIELQEHFKRKNDELQRKKSCSCDEKEQCLCASGSG